MIKFISPVNIIHLVNHAGLIKLFYQFFENSDLTANGCVVERGFTSLVFVLDVRALFDQKLDTFFKTANDLEKLNNF